MIPASPGGDRGYALDFGAAVRYVATELEQGSWTIRELVQRAARARAGRPRPGDPRVLELYESRHGSWPRYQPLHGDLSRVRLNHGLDTDEQATTLVLDRAVSALGEQVRGPTAKGRYRLAIPFEDLRFEERPITRYY